MALGLKDIEKKKTKKVPKIKSSRKPSNKDLAQPNLKSSPWDSVGAPSATAASTAAPTPDSQDQQSKRKMNMKEQGLELLKKTIGLALEKKAEIVKSEKFQTIYNLGKQQVESQLSKYPKLQSEITARVEQLGVCEKAQTLENMLREFANGEIRNN